ncbi:HAD family hydrolase [Paenibacillus larvae]
MAVKAVMFDLDDTLLWDERSVKEAFKTTCEEAVRYYPQLSSERLEKSVRQEARSLYESYETYPYTKQIGINPFEALWARFTMEEDENLRKLKQIAPLYRKEAWKRGLAALGIEDGLLAEQLGERFIDERRKRPYIYEDTFEVLDQLKGRYTILLLTNGAPDLQQEKIDGIKELAPYFDHIIISGKFGEGKPSVAIFHHALDLLKVKKEEVIMVGDKLTTDILGASRAGIKNVWINRNKMSRTDEIIPTFEITQLKELLPLISSI